MDQPNLIIIAGCNGAGKTTAAYKILSESLEGIEFVNADEIARDLRIDNPNSTDIEAGRIMLERMDTLLGLLESFAIETTLASRSLMSLIDDANSSNYKVRLIYFWLESPELAVERVKSRVRHGGHNIPPLIIERRYHRGLRNLLNLYMPMIDDWVLYDNTKTMTEVIARRIAGGNIIVENFSIFTKLIKAYGNG